MIQVRMAVKHVHFGHTLDSFQDGLDYFGAAGL
jgi:hypothetical protein